MALDELRTLLAIGLAGLLLMLRLDASRFGGAEYDRGPDDPDTGSIAMRLAWPAMAVALTGVIAVILPSGAADVGLDRSTFISAGTIVLSLVGCGLGIGAVLLLGWLADGRWPPVLLGLRQVPAAALDAVGTALVDELAFRGVLLGLLLAGGVPALLAFLIQVLAYGLATRLGASTRTFGLLVEDLLLGAAMGVLTLLSGGVVAAIVVHAVTRFAALAVRDVPRSLAPWAVDRP
jgi:hypothetical protein